MNRRRQWLALAAVLAAVVLGVASLFDLRLSGGDSYPAYSTLRADPLGTRALFDSLAALPSLQVERSLKPLAKLDASPSRTLILAGMDRATWDLMPPATFSRLNALARDGTRLVVVFRAEFKRDKDSTRPRHDDAPPPPAEKSPPEKTGKLDASKLDIFPDWSDLWHIRLSGRWLMTTDGNLAHRAPAAPSDLPATLGWASDFYFQPEPGSPWRVLYTRASEPVMVEKPIGAGSIVLATDSYFLSNEALQRDRATPLLAWIVGPRPRIVFDESHLGVEEDPGVATLARRYGLQWAFFTALLLAALFIWQRLALFVPPPPPASELAPGHEPLAGIKTLLRRAVPAGALFSTCLAEWRRTASPGDIARVTAAPPPASRPVEAYNHAVRALKKKFTA